MKPKITHEIRYGTDEDGKEFLDEVLLYVDGKCIMHMESMDIDHMWIGLYPDDAENVHVNLWVDPMDEEKDEENRQRKDGTSLGARAEVNA